MINPMGADGSGIGMGLITYYTAQSSRYVSRMVAFRYDSNC
jgi:hypothetical protein